MPAVKICSGARGEPASPTLAGPPERMMPFGGEGGDFFGIGVERPDFAIDAGFADPAGDQLGDLAAEIQNQNFFIVHVWLAA